jgi:phage baseplate assembly protein W
MSEKAISLPFSIDPYGKVSMTTEQTKIWADRVRSVVGTTIKERVMRPTFGSTIAFGVFDTEEAADQEIRTSVAEVFNTQLQTLTLNNVTTSFDEYTGTLFANITYGLPNDVVLTTTIGLVTLVGNNPPIEETL